MGLRLVVQADERLTNKNVAFLRYSGGVRIRVRSEKDDP